MTIRVFAAILLLAVSLLAQTAQPGRQTYLFFSNLDTADTEEKINQLAADGYRLVGLQQVNSGALTVAMQNIAPAGDTRYEYKLLGGHFQRYLGDKNPLSPRLAEAGEQGYRCVRGTLLNTLPENWNATPNEKGFAMERIRGAENARVEYRLERAMMASNAMNDLQRDMHDGFEAILTFPFVGERASLLEKVADSEKPFDPGAPKHSKTAATLAGSLWPVRVSVSEQGLETINFMAKHKRAKLDDLTRRGMHLLALTSGPNAYFAGIAAAMPSTQKPLYLYGELKTRKNTPPDEKAKLWSRVEQELNAAAASGYGIGLRPALVNTSNFAITEFTLHYIIPMQPTAEHVRYKIVVASSLPDLSVAVNEAAAAGWSIAPGMLFGDSLVILEKRDAEATP